MTCDRSGAPSVEWIRYRGEHLCRDHFLEFVERRTKRELRSQVDFRGGERVAVGMSGGKDSSATAFLLAKFLGNRGDIELIGITINKEMARASRLISQMARMLNTDQNSPGGR